MFNTGDHAHPSDLERNARELIKLKMVEQCAMDPSVPPRRVYDTVCDNLSSEDSDAVPTFRLIHDKHKQLLELEPLLHYMNKKSNEIRLKDHVY